MKIRSFAIAALALLLVWPAAAQSSWTSKAKASVPFAFVVNGTDLPAGDYRIMTQSGKMLLIQNVDKPELAVVVQNRDIVLVRGELVKDSKLVFSLNNGKHVLHRIAVAEDGHIHDIIHGEDVVELAVTP